MNIYHRNARLLLLMVLSVFWQVAYAEQKAAETNKPLSIDNFTKLPGVRDLQISPDGKYLSVVFKKNNEDMLGILEAATMKPTGFFSVKGDGKGVGTVSWVNNTRLVYTVTESYIWDKQVFENGELAGVDVDGSNHKVIFGYRAGYSTKRNRIKRKKSDYGNHDIIDLLPDDDNNILLAFYPWKLIGKTYKPNRTAHPIIYKLNIDSGRKRKVDILPIPQSRAITDNQGNVRFAVG
ncbi:MAG: hypothetical protein HRT35_29725, partial [Algicola sp.]|nr:hypothetical protein [Algicola sp.]